VRFNTGTRVHRSAGASRCASRRRNEETTPLIFLNPHSFVSASTMLVAAAIKIVPRQDVRLQQESALELNLTMSISGPRSSESSERTLQLALSTQPRWR